MMSGTRDIRAIKVFFVSGRCQHFWPSPAEIDPEQTRVQSAACLAYRMAVFQHLEARDFPSEMVSISAK